MERTGFSPLRWNNLGLITMNFTLAQVRHRVGLAVSATLLSACASVGPGPSATPGTDKGATVAAPSLGFFSHIKAPGDREAVLKLGARGAQVFRCEKRDGQGVWVFRQPDAELLDDKGKVVGRHGANFSFEHSDGSRLVATIAAYDDAPKPTDLRWLLMTTRSFGTGAFEGVTHAQRVNTAGGTPPTSCDLALAGRVRRIDFTADFIFYRPRGASAQ
jgi:hypothetical protein